MFAQVKSADALFLGTARLETDFRFLRQFIEYGLKDKMARDRRHDGAR